MIYSIPTLTIRAMKIVGATNPSRDPRARETGAGCHLARANTGSQVTDQRLRILNSIAMTAIHQFEPDAPWGAEPEPRGTAPSVPGFGPPF